MSKTYRIACIPGDGIGPEVTRQARKALDVAANRFGFSLDWQDYPFGAAHYLRTGEIFPESALEEMGGCDALLLGAIGDPRVKPGELERGILLTLRFRFDQYVNLRPALSFPRVPLPVPLPEGRRLDAVVVRENTEDLYMGLGGRAEGGSLSFSVEARRAPYELKGELALWTTPPCPLAAQVAVSTRPGVERIARYACELAVRRGEDRVTLVTKANAVPHLYGFFEDETARVAAQYPGLKLEKENVDACCYHLVRRPDAFGVLLCPNLFGDIVSDLLAGLSGGMGMAAGGNIGDGLSMFEPVHGSAPDIAGTGRANPLAAILSGELLLRHLGEHEAADAVGGAVTAYLEESDPEGLPFELGGTSPVERSGDEVASHIAG